MKSLTKKEMALLLMAIHPLGSDSDYWDNYKGKDMPDIMKRNGIKTPKECGKVSDSAYIKLKKLLNS